MDPNDLPDAADLRAMAEIGALKMGGFSGALRVRLEEAAGENGMKIIVAACAPTGVFALCLGPPEIVRNMRYSVLGVLWSPHASVNFLFSLLKRGYSLSDTYKWGKVHSGGRYLEWENGGTPQCWATLDGEAAALYVNPFPPESGMEDCSE